MKFNFVFLVFLICFNNIISFAQSDSVQVIVFKIQSDTAIEISRKKFHDLNQIDISYNNLIAITNSKKWLYLYDFIDDEIRIRKKFVKDKINPPNNLSDICFRPKSNYLANVHYNGKVREYHDNERINYFIVQAGGYFSSIQYSKDALFLYISSSEYQSPESRMSCVFKMSIFECKDRNLSYPDGVSIIQPFEKILMQDSLSFSNIKLSGTENFVAAMTSDKRVFVSFNEGKDIIQYCYPDRNLVDYQFVGEDSILLALSDGKLNLKCLLNSEKASIVFDLKKDIKSVKYYVKYGLFFFQGNEEIIITKRGENFTPWKNIQLDGTVLKTIVTPDNDYLVVVVGASINPTNHRP